MINKTPIIIIVAPVALSLIPFSLKIRYAQKTLNNALIRFITATKEANQNMLAQYEALNREVLNRLVNGGTKLIAYSPEIMDAAQKESFALYEENASKDATFKEVYEQWKQFREQVYQWNRINQDTFTNFVTRSL